jgi:GT2 family glycosyltransferase
MATLKAARGEIIVCTDDDCYVEPNFLNVALEAFRDPRVGMITGRILLFDADDAPVAIQTSTRSRRFNAGEVLRAGEVQGASLAYRRRAAIAAGGFDPLLGAGTPFPAEDLDFGLRVLAAGWDALYVPEFLVLHHHGRDQEAAARLTRGYRIGAGAVYAKALLEQTSMRRKVLRAWVGQQYLWLRKAPTLLLYEYFGAISYLLARHRAARGA